MERGRIFHSIAQSKASPAFPYLHHLWQSLLWQSLLIALPDSNPKLHGQVRDDLITASLLALYKEGFFLLVQLRTVK